MTSDNNPETDLPRDPDKKSDHFKWCWLNDSLIESDTASVSIFDRGYLYGDGLFETIRVQDGNLFQWQRHLARLKSGCEGLKIKTKISDQSLKEKVLKLVQMNKAKFCTARIQFSRGVGPRGYLPPNNPTPTLTITLHSASQLSVVKPKVWRVIVSSMKMPTQWASTQWKTSNKLFQTLVKQEAYEAGADDAMILNEFDHITELSCANLFLIKGDQILTPPVKSGILPGTTRALVLDICKQIGIDFQETVCDLGTLNQATSAFATLSTLGLIHLNQIADKSFDMHPMEQVIYDSYLKRLKIKS